MNILGIIIISISFLTFILTLFYEKLREHIKLILPITIAFGLLGYGLMIYDRVTELTLPGGISIKTVEQKILERAEFVEKTEKLVLAQSETIGLVAKQANEMQPEISRMAGEIKKFESFLNEMKDTLQKEYQAVSEEVSRVKLQNYLPMLRDKAVNQHDREAFEEMFRIARIAPENSPLQEQAINMYRYVAQAFINQYYGDPVLTITLEDGTVRSDWEISTARLMTSLSDANWEVRARAAALLSRRPEKGVPDSLLHVARTDKNLKVVSNGLISFGHIAKGIARPRAAGDAPISQTEFIELLNINKLDQWWKEHYAEVNERLTPAESQ